MNVLLSALALTVTVETNNSELLYKPLHTLKNRVGYKLQVLWNRHTTVSRNHFKCMYYRRCFLATSISGNPRESSHQNDALGIINFSSNICETTQKTMMHVTLCQTIGAISKLVLYTRSWRSPSFYRYMSYIVTTFSLQLPFNTALTKQVRTLHTSPAAFNAPSPILSCFSCHPSASWLSPHSRGQVATASPCTDFLSKPGPWLGCHRMYLLCHPQLPETPLYLDLRKAFLTKMFLCEQFWFWGVNIFHWNQPK